MKKLVGGTDSDIEDALLRLENAILEETRMAGAESLKGINMLQATMRDLESKFDGFMLQERMKNITANQATNSINSAKITVQSVIFTADNVFMVRYGGHSKSKSEAK